MTEESAIICPCPRCKKPMKYDKNNEFRPFCSALCKNEDIISWANEDYKADGGPVDPETLIEEISHQNRNGGD